MCFLSNGEAIVSVQSVSNISWLGEISNITITGAAINCAISLRILGGGSSDPAYISVHIVVKALCMSSRSKFMVSIPFAVFVFALLFRLEEAT